MSYGTVKKGDDYCNSSGQKIKIMKNTQTEMGKISNLITDMTLKGATQDELARAVRHSMVVIDAVSYTHLNVDLLDYLDGLNWSLCLQFLLYRQQMA